MLSPPYDPPQTTTDLPSRCVHAQGYGVDIVFRNSKCYRTQTVSTLHSKFSGSSPRRLKVQSR